MLIKTINIGFDINTNNIGYCCLINGKAFLLGDKFPSMGVVKAVKQETYTFKNETKERNVEFDKYGNRMFWGSGLEIKKLASIFYQLFRAIGKQYEPQVKDKPELPKINIVFEISEIPNKTFQNYQSITSVRKLALYVGMVVYSLFNVADNVGQDFIKQENTTIKLITPGEWQHRIGVRANDKEVVKQVSINKANELLRLWGFEPINNDDLADAINIANLADVVRDSIFVKAKNRKLKRILLETLPREIIKLEQKALKIKNKALNKKEKKLKDILKAKNSKFDWKIENERPTSEFLTPKELANFKELKEKILAKQKLLGDLKNERNQKLKDKTNY